MRIVPATAPLPPYSAFPTPLSPPPPFTDDNPSTHITENGDVLTEQNHAPQTNPDQRNPPTTDPSDIRVPSPQNPPPSLSSGTPSPLHTGNSSQSSSNYPRGTGEFPPTSISPVPPGTNVSTDYSSIESIDEACAEHAERLLRIVTPPELGDSCESGDEVEGEGVKEVEGGRELDTLTSEDCRRARETRDGERENCNTKPHNLPPIPAASPSHTTGTGSDSGTIHGNVTPPESPFSLSNLGLPATPVTPTAAPQLVGPMSWWAEALAETENMEDIDALVEKLGGGALSGEGGGVESAVRGVSGAGEGEIGDSSGVVQGSNISTEEELMTAGNSTTETNSTSPDASPPATTMTTPPPPRSSSPRRSPSPSAGSAHSDEVAYIVQAGRLIRQALDLEQKREFEEAFDLFKAAVDILLNGVQSECDCHVISSVSVM